MEIIRPALDEMIKDDSFVEQALVVGDWVKIGSPEGTVEQINIPSTRLRSSKGVLQIIPNGTIATVENMTRDWSLSAVTWV